MVPKTHLPKYEIGAHFLTARTFQSVPFFRDPACARTLCEELEAARAGYGFHVLAFVVMSDHIRLLLWWEANARPGLTISKVAWAVKGRSAQWIGRFLKGEEWIEGGVGDSSAIAHQEKLALLQPVREPSDRPHYRNWRYKMWQHGAGYDFNVYTTHKLQEKVAYIHANPVRAGLISRPQEYLWSSAINYRADGNAFGYPIPSHLVQITLYMEVL